MPKTAEIIEAIRVALSNLSSHGEPIVMPIPCRACQGQLDGLARLADAIERDGIEDFEETIERAAGLAAQADAERLTGELAECRAELLNVQVERDFYRDQAKFWERESRGATVARNAAQRERDEARGELADCRLALVDMRNERDRARRERESMRFDLAEAKGDRTRLRGELAEARAKLDQVGAELAGARDQAAADLAVIDSLGERLNRTAGEREEARRKVEALTRELVPFVALRLALPDVLDRAGLDWTRDLLKLGDITPARAVSNLGEVVGTLRGLLKDSQAKHDAALAELAQAKSEAAALRRALAEADQFIAGPVAVLNNRGAVLAACEPFDREKLRALITRFAAKLRPFPSCCCLPNCLRPCAGCNPKPDATNAPADQVDNRRGES